MNNHLHNISSNNQVIIFGVGGNNHNILDSKHKYEAHLIVDPDEYSNFKIVSLSCGGDFLMLLLKDKLTRENRLITAGYNGNGEQGVPIPLGNNSTKLRDITDEVLLQINRENTKILQAQCGWNHTMILVEYDSTNENTTVNNRELALYGTGFNNHGQLSTGNTSSSTYFVKSITDHIPLYQIERLISGLNTCAIITKDRNLYISGNLNGELGNPTTYKFEHTFSNVLDAAFSYTHSVIIDMDGQVWSAGKNEYGKLGISDLNNTSEFVKVDFPEKAIKVSLGIHHTMILTESNTVYGVGYNENGVLGINETEHSKTFKLVKSPYLFKDISCGFYNSAFLTINNQVMLCGSKWKTVSHDQQCKKKLIPQFLYCKDELFSNVNSICSGGYFLVAFYKEVTSTKQLREMFNKLKSLVLSCELGHALSDIIIKCN